MLDDMLHVLRCAQKDGPGVSPRPAPTCVLCRHWKPLGQRFGECCSADVKRHIKVPRRLVTRDTFMCLFFSAVTERTDPRKPDATQGES